MLVALSFNLLRAWNWPNDLLLGSIRQLPGCALLIGLLLLRTTLEQLLQVEEVQHAVLEARVGLLQFSLGLWREWSRLRALGHRQPLSPRFNPAFLGLSCGCPRALGLDLLGHPPNHPSCSRMPRAFWLLLGLLESLFTRSSVLRMVVARVLSAVGHKVLMVVRHGSKSPTY